MEEFAMVNKERILAEFFELVKIPASSRKERQIADVVIGKLQALGLDVQEDDAGAKIGGDCGNIIAYKKGNLEGAPVVMLSAHLDCVEPCSGIEPVLKDGIITSAGDTILGGDDKAGVVAILEALRQLDEQKLMHGDIQVVFTVAEEGGLNGSKNIDQTLLKADFGYALDSSGAPGEIIVMAPGQDSIIVTVHGKKAHAGVAPEEGLNAIVLAGKALSELKQGRIDFETTANVGIISGGVATNIVPDQVELKCEARSRNMEKLAVQTRHMQETFEKVCAANGGKATVVTRRAYNPYVLEENAHVVATAVKAVEALGLTPKCVGTGGGSDANFFNSYGIPTAVLGVGMSKVHTTDEFIKEEDLYNDAELSLAIILQAAKK